MNKIVKKIQIEYVDGILERLNDKYFPDAGYSLANLIEDLEELKNAMRVMSE